MMEFLKGVISYRCSQFPHFFAFFTHFRDPKYRPPPNPPQSGHETPPKKPPGFQYPSNSELDHSRVNPEKPKAKAPKRPKYENRGQFVRKLGRKKPPRALKNLPKGEIFEKRKKFSILSLK